MKSILFYLPVLAGYDQFQKGLAGVNSQNYQNMLWQISQQAKLADDLGYWGLSFTEHHFHVEGFEGSNNPILLDLYVAMQTKKIRVGQMANALPFHNPLRLAEDLAMLDQMSGGRAFVGIARGYQKRWADVMGQLFDVGAAPSDRSEVDLRNRRLFEEHWAIMKKAWTELLFSHEGKHWKIPPAGLDFDYPAIREFGGGLDNDGTITQIGVVPKPFQRPYPQVFQPFSASEETFRFCAREGMVPLVMNTDDEIVRHLFDVYQQEAEESGYGRLKRGERIGIIKDVVVSRDAAEAHYWAQRGSGFCFDRWFGPLGFSSALRNKGETGPVGTDYATLNARGFEWVGTPDDINRKIEKTVALHNPEYLLQCQYSTLIPNDVQLRSLELWATDIAPNWV
ncbi:LLM class flavin-dependent oxidoreductase [Streptomyces sp. V1I1]|uniref:LLM class flavin-dependent oxidoreductase n=1 Tax=Streptomyces sp. V1I1 TaxID=3042272 RepID=UPI00278755FE|nr:LLM class flavin-dependent oxidoreductase [Streptomyces sp. V1I1]MDQ0938389.1 alkanesulfonate monooxygenase SsuD/methylene tetrahydromethanopterin reductase-like flavin-dependent oxidoreductase (luciferase family) [Streptomyces sp. V1I1]